MAELTVPQGTMIGFSANKTETQAKADKTSHRMTICKEKTLYMDGQRLGLSDTEAEYLQRKLNEEFAAKVGVTMTTTMDNKVQDAAAPVEVTVTVKTTFNGAPIDADTTPTITATGATPVLTKSDTGVYTCTLDGKNTPVTITASATVKGITKSPSNKVINAYHKIHYGVSALDVISATGPIPTGFTTMGPKANASGTYTFKFTDDTYGYILVPTSTPGAVALAPGMSENPPVGSEGVLPVNFTKLANVVVGGVTYTQFRTASKMSASTHNVTF